MLGADEVFFDMGRNAFCTEKIEAIIPDDDISRRIPVYAEIHYGAENIAVGEVIGKFCGKRSAF